MLLKPNNKFRDKDIYDRSGMWVGKDKNSLIVFDVVKGGPADEAGIEVGDGILKFEGKPSQNFKIDEVRARLRTPGNDAVKITYLSGKTTHDAIVKLRDLL